jgi:hypothetical protein
VQGGLAVVGGVPRLQHVSFEQSPLHFVSPGNAMYQSSQKSLKSDPHVMGSQHSKGVHPSAGHIVLADLNLVPLVQFTFPGSHMLRDAPMQQTFSLHGTDGSGGGRSQISLHMGAELSCLCPVLFSLIQNVVINSCF